MMTQRDQRTGMGYCGGQHKQLQRQPHRRLRYCLTAALLLSLLVVALVYVYLALFSGYRLTSTTNKAPPWLTVNSTNKKSVSKSSQYQETDSYEDQERAAEGLAGDEEEETYTSLSASSIINTDVRSTNSRNVSLSSQHREVENDEDLEKVPETLEEEKQEEEIHPSLIANAVNGSSIIEHDINNTGTTSSSTLDFYFSDTSAGNITKSFFYNPFKWRPRPETDFPLQFPVFVASLPKSGTTSIHNFFLCGGVRSAHNFCPFATAMPGKSADRRHIGVVMEANIKRGYPPFLGCGKNVRLSTEGPVNAFSDAGYVEHRKKACFYPSVTALDALYRSYPNMTIILGNRNSFDWFESVRKWGGGRLIYQWMKLCSFMPNHNNEMEFIDFYEWHNDHVRDFAKRHPSITFIEFDIDSPTAGMELGRQTNISTFCWGHFNQKEESV